MITPIQAVASNTLTTTITATGGSGASGLIVCVNSVSSGSPSISSVKLGTTSLTVVKSNVYNYFSSAYLGSYIYYLASAASGQTSVVITGTNLAVDSSSGGVAIFEVPGTLSLDSGVNNAAGNAGSTYSSGSSGAPSQAGDFFVGSAAVFGTAGKPTGSWTNLPSGSQHWAAGYLTDSDETAETYSASASTAWSAVIAAFKVAGTFKQSEGFMALIS